MIRDNPTMEGADLLEILLARINHDWSEQEEAKYKEALNKYGKSWV